MDSIFSSKNRIINDLINVTFLHIVNNIIKFDILRTNFINVDLFESTYEQDGTLKSDILTNEIIPDLNKVVAEALAAEAAEDDPSSTSSLKSPLLQTKVDNLSPVIDFLEGKNCLTGVSIDQIHIFDTIAH